jgi:histidinol phosphatase-like enzyme
MEASTKEQQVQLEPPEIREVREPRLPSRKQHKIMVTKLLRQPTTPKTMSDKVSVVGDKLKDLQNADLGELAENAKSYARQKPGQALLISAGVGLLLGLIIRGRR